MAKFCGKCGSPLNSTAVFCGGCGSKVPNAAPPANAPAVVAPVTTPDASGFAPLPATLAPAPVIPPDAGGFAPVSSAFESAPASVPDASSFAPVEPTFPPAPVSRLEAGGFAPVPAAFTPPPATTSDVSGFAPLPAAFAPSPVGAPDPAGFAPLPPAFTPAPVATPPPVAAAPAQADYGPLTAAPSSAPNYAPVPGASGLPPAYAQSVPGNAGQPPAYAPAQANYAPGGAYPAAKKSNTLLKVVVAFVVVLFVGGALALAGLWYAAQQIKAKAHSVTAKVLAGNPPGAGTLGSLISGATSGDSDSDNPGGFKGDPCRFLSKEEVGQAIGVPIIRTESENGGCTYIAQGDPADMTAKHMSAMVGGMGVDAKSQQTVQKIAGAFFAQQQAADKDLSAQAAKKEMPVVGLMFTAGHAATEMKLNKGAFARIAGSPKTDRDLSGIGDEASEVAGSMILLRKGNTMVRIMYNACPCGTQNVIPLARTLASRL